MIKFTINNMLNVILKTMYTKTEWSGMRGYIVEWGAWVAQVQVSLFEDEPTMPISCASLFASSVLRLILCSCGYGSGCGCSWCCKDKGWRDMRCGRRYDGIWLREDQLNGICLTINLYAFFLSISIFTLVSFSLLFLNNKLLSNYIKSSFFRLRFSTFCGNWMFLPFIPFVELRIIYLVLYRN